MAITAKNIFDNSYRYEALFNYASLGIIIVNEEAIIQSINPFALDLFKYTIDEILGNKIELLIPQRYHHNHGNYRNNYIHKPNNRPMGVGLDLFGMKKDGTEFPVEVSLSHYNDKEGKHVIAFISDISIRKKAEAKLEELNNNLESTVEYRTKQLKEAMLELEHSKEELSILLEKEKELNELKSGFISMASHEFRTPLSTVLSSAYLVEKYTTTEDQPKRLKHIQRIISSVQMLTDILNDFLSVGKIEEGKIQVRLSSFNIQDLINNLVRELENNAKKGQEITYVHQGNAAVVLDPVLLKHIMMNLISNAVKYSPEDSAITIHSYGNKSSIKICIKDEGIGISEEDQKHLMQRFFRGANVTNIQGTGLGLHIVAKYAELMNGTIQCKSVVNQGSEFIVALPNNLEIL
ncbi:MAG: PAS domain-containing sensor histidine kinase [Arachidicoccus sp.]|nr:PAS domain-containing sensor histidine kinase [Arachidicoccus sp.]